MWRARGRERAGCVWTGCLSMKQKELGPRASWPGNSRRLTMGAVLTFAILWVVSLWRWLGWEGTNLTIYVGSGRIGIIYIGTQTRNGEGWFTYEHPTAPPVILDWSFAVDLSAKEYFLAVPLWVPLLCGLLVFALGLSARKASRELRCMSCGYDLTGSSSGICPECGKKCEPPAE